MNWGLRREVKTRETDARRWGGRMVGNCEGWYKSEVKRRSGTRTMSRPSPGRGSAGYPAFRSVPEFGPVLHKRLRCRDSDALLTTSSITRLAMAFRIYALFYASSTSTESSGVFFYLPVLSFPAWNRTAPSQHQPVSLHRLVCMATCTSHYPLRRAACGIDCYDIFASGSCRCWYLHAPTPLLVNSATHILASRIPSPHV